MSARAVHIFFVRHDRAEQIVKTGREETQPRSEIQDIRCGKNGGTTWAKNAIDLAQDLPVILEVFKRFAAGNQIELAGLEWKRLMIEIHNLNLLVGSFHQLI